MSAIDDAAIDRVLADYPAPPPSAGLARRIVAEASRADRQPRGIGPAPRPAAARPWRRTRWWVGVASVNLALVGAAAATVEVARHGFARIAALPAAILHPHQHAVVAHQVRHPHVHVVHHHAPPPAAIAAPLPLVGAIPVATPPPAAPNFATMRAERRLARIERLHSGAAALPVPLHPIPPRALTRLERRDAKAEHVHAALKRAHRRLLERRAPHERVAISPPSPAAAPIERLAERPPALLGEEQRRAFARPADRAEPGMIDRPFARRGWWRRQAAEAPARQAGAGERKPRERPLGRRGGMFRRRLR